MLYTSYYLTGKVFFQPTTKVNNSYRIVLLILLIFHSILVETAFIKPIINHDYQQQMSLETTLNNIENQKKINLQRREYELTNEFDVEYVNIDPFDLIVGYTYQPVINLEVVDEIKDVIQSLLIKTWLSSLDNKSLRLIRDVELAGAEIKFRGGSESSNNRQLRNTRFLETTTSSFNESYTTLIRLEGGVAEFAFSMMYSTPSEIELNQTILNILSNQLLPEIQQHISALSSVSFVHVFDKVVTEKPTSYPTQNPTKQEVDKTLVDPPTASPVTVSIPKTPGEMKVKDDTKLDTSSKPSSKQYLFLLIIGGVFVFFTFLVIGLLIKRSNTSKRIRSYDSRYNKKSFHVSSKTKYDLRNNNETFDSDVEEDDDDNDSSMSFNDQRSSSSNKIMKYSNFLQKKKNKKNEEKYHSTSTARDTTTPMARTKTESFEYVRTMELAIVEKGMLDSSRHWSIEFPQKEEYTRDGALNPTDFSPSMFVLSDSFASDSSSDIMKQQQIATDIDKQGLRDEDDNKICCR